MTYNGDHIPIIVIGDTGRYTVNGGSDGNGSLNCHRANFGGLFVGTPEDEAGLLEVSGYGNASHVVPELYSALQSLRDGRHHSFGTHLVNARAAVRSAITCLEHAQALRNGATR